MAGVTKKDNVIKGAENRHAILYWLYRFGYLTVAQIASLVWLNQAQARTMANRTLRSLLELGLIKVNTIAPAVKAYFLSEEGYDLLDMQIEEVFTNDHYTHRAIGNWWLILKLNNGGCDYFLTEHEIATGRGFNGVLGMSGKVPDAYYFQDGLATLIEVENAYKNTAKRAKFVELAKQLDIDANYYLSDDYVLNDIEFVCGTKESAQAVIRTFSEAHSEGQLSEYALSCIRVHELRLDSRLNQIYYASYPVLAYADYSADKQCYLEHYAFTLGQNR